MEFIDVGRFDSALTAKCFVFWSQIGSEAVDINVHIEVRCTVQVDDENNTQQNAKKNLGLVLRNSVLA